MENLTNKNIVLGISGSVAFYKSMGLIRKLRKSGANVRVVLTKSAQQFVTPLSLQAISGNAVETSLFDEHHELAMGHIELAKWADAVVIAPCSANLIARLRVGMADDLLSTLCLATSAPILLAPAMNTFMFQKAVVQENLEALQARGIKIINGKAGEQACGDVGMGRMAEIEEILPEIGGLFVPQDCQGIRVLITAGATREPLDPVRFITNHSSGKMGFALAENFARRGADVTIVSANVDLTTPSTPKVIKRIDVGTAEEMLKICEAEAPHNQIFIACAAVADFRPQEISPHKLKKDPQNPQEIMQLNLVKNPDIVAKIAKMVTNRPFVVGFAAETKNLAEYAVKKLTTKNLDLIFANDISNNQGFNQDQNAIQAFWFNGDNINSQQFPLMSKSLLSQELISLIMEKFFLHTNQ